MKGLPTDEEMIRQLLSGQPNQCFETLYNRYVDKVYRQCLSMTQDSEKAQDFTHDIFIKVFDKLDAFQQRSSFSTWIYSIAYNYCADQIRLSRRLNTTAIDHELEQHVTESQETVLREEAIQLVNRALASLSPDEQHLLRLKYEDKVSIEEIGRMHNLTISAVKMRLKRSRAKIEQFYARQQAR
ncbi:RNA polymerase sigma factor [Spirosoma validum]|uniref:RNA polymerase sigma factor n=1 Tax=Spirosoma validum TaxID=2771355 RepID=A0A927B2K6_9BACT|nr:RNA polymerase sigma factor [Spirosoma validum]MBD2754097.1 RNA polymerase sigma factor [Spirosoma validum]